MKQETESNLRWHLENNVMPSLTPKTVDSIIDTLTDYKAGNKSLDDHVNEFTTVTIGELMEDLRLTEEDLQ